MPESPLRVFVSYTGEDLEAYANKALEVIRLLGWVAVDHRDWGASGTPSVAECRERILGAEEDEKPGCDLLVVLVAHRYGWVPEPKDGGDGETSITWMEVRWAGETGKPVLPFLVVDDYPWPPDAIEGRGNAVALERLERFKGELRRGICNFFTDTASLATKLALALPEEAKKVNLRKPEVARQPPDPGTLRYLLKGLAKCADILKKENLGWGAVCTLLIVLSLAYFVAGAVNDTQFMTLTGVFMLTATVFPLNTMLRNQRQKAALCIVQEELQQDPPAAEAVIAAKSFLERYFLNRGRRHD